MTAGCRVLSPLCFTHSLSPSLHLQSALHREKHVEGNCKCAELWESVYAECTSVSERQGQGIRKRNYKRGARFAPGIIVIVCCMCVSMHVTVCTLQCWTGKVAASAHPSLGLCSIWGQHCVSGSVGSGPQSGMKGRRCWEPGTIRSLCNSGCLSSLNQGQYSFG